MSSTSNPTPPLVTNIYTADPSAHSFNGRLYVYPSHDRETPIQFNDKGDQYDMVDYHVLSMNKVGAQVTDHGVALRMEDIPWVKKQLWAPDAFKGQDGRYWLCFPARDQDGIFRLGLAHSDKPEGPFTPHAKPIPKSFTIDPATFVDADGSVYAYFGGIWGGQLQCYSDAEGTKFDASQDGPHEPTGKGVPALCPRVAKLAYNASAPAGEAYGSFDEAVREVVILDPATKEPLLADDHEKRFFEASWMHVKDGVYYFSYSTGDTHFIAYATGDNPYGPFTYRGTILPPVVGWTTHHSIVEHDGRWWLFYHDCERSDGVSHLRSVRVREVWYDAEGNISIEKP